MIIWEQSRVKGNNVEGLRKERKDLWVQESAWYIKNIETIKYSERQKEVDWVRKNQKIRPLRNINV